MSFEAGRLGKYQIERPLGQGGMGVVFLAYDPVLERKLAIKLIESRGNDAASRAQVLREARNASALNHPNICTVYEVGEDQGRTFIAMEYVDGLPLCDLITRRALPVEEAVRYAAEAADALAHAHDRGIVHGDLKGANAIVSLSGRLKVVDFGLARRVNWPAADPTTLVTSAGMGTGPAVGTPYAMAPEQVRGAEADGRSDVWALGVLLFEMLAGTRPFSAPTVPELFTSILRDPPLPLPPHIPEPLRQIVVKCLSKAQMQRYQRAADVRLVLEVAASSLRRLETPPSGSTVAAGAPLPPPPVVGDAVGVEFVGREGEIERLADAWTRAKGGRRQVVLLAGEPGIGKTRLSMKFARACADEGATVLVGRSDEEALIPYQPFVEALTWYVRVCPEADLRAQLGVSGCGAELAQIVPDVLRRCPDLAPSPAMNAESQRYRLFEGVAALLTAACAVRPVLLVFEDLHWADKSALLMLRHLVRSSGQAALCVIGTYRESELDRTRPLADMLADLRGESAVTRVSLRGLDEAHVRGLIDAIAGRGAPPEFARLMSETTDGNPFFVGEMLRHLQESGLLARVHGMSTTGASVGDLGLPEGVKEVIGRRLSRTSEDCNRALSLAAVVGREFDIAILEALGDLTEDRLLDAIDEGVRAQLVGEAPGGRGRFSFLHALVRETLYGELTSLRRVRLHRRVGEAIEHLAHGKPNSPLADLAYHFFLAAPGGPPDKAVDYATRAGDRAADALAYEEAARFYDMALQSLEFQVDEAGANARRVDLHTRRARAFGALALWALEKQAAEQALRYLDSQEIERRAELVLVLADASFYLLDIPSVQRFATEGLKLAEQVQRSDLAADAIGWLARCRQADGKLGEAIDLDRTALARGRGRKGVALIHGPLTLYLAGRTAEAVTQSAHAAEIARSSSRDTEFVVYALSHFALSLGSVGRYTEAAQVFDEARQFGRKYGVLPPLARATALSAGFHLGVFDFEGAEALQLEARDESQRLAFAPTLVSASIDLLLTFARRHDPARAERLLEETSAAVIATPGWHEWLWRLRLTQARAELALARGTLGVAVTEAAAAIEQSRATGRPKYEALGRITRARALDRLARKTDAIADARDAVAAARGTMDPALLLQAIDTLLALDGSDELLTEARTLVERIRAALPDDTMRRRFNESEVVQHVQRF